MKPKVLIPLILLLTGANIHAQSEFHGSWSLICIANETIDNKDVTSEEELKANGLIWVMTFSSDGTFMQSANLNDSKRMDKASGSWELEEEDALIVRIPNRSGQLRPIKYFYTMEGRKLVLERYDPMNTRRLVLSFVKD